MSLIREIADDVEDVAAGFRGYREPLPEHAAEITSLIADLYGISAYLNSIDGAARSRQFPQNFLHIQDDLELLRSSLGYTLDDIVLHFRQLERHGHVTLNPYKRTWGDLHTFFFNESGHYLPLRLQKYKIFLKELENIMQNKPSDVPLLRGLRRDIEVLLSKQVNPPRLDPLDSPESIIAEGSQGHVPRQRSYERRRPRFPPSTFSSPSGPLSPVLPQEIPPSAPEIPGSPTSNSTTTHSNTSVGLSDHWAKKVLLDDLSATRIPSSNESSKCFGDEMPRIKEWLLDEGFEEVLALSFNDGPDLSVRFHVRESDRRARIVCKVRHSTRASEYFCLPLNMLVVLREGSCLRLCRKRRSGTEFVLWTSLKFRTIERMVIFYCTFLALRSQDSGRPVENIEDYELEDEEEIFGGHVPLKRSLCLHVLIIWTCSQILDDGYLHALRIYRDTVSGAVRLQASIHKGEMKRAPVWTAFVTHHISSPAWIRWSDHKTLYVRELRRAIFSPEYVPPRTQRGEHILKFASRSDAESFYNIITELKNSS
ncbi:hypothetical protein Egran_02258 [Elaphomyces granulatus]|uniref:Uncharacterized protein n=1 Tax=Elaphomyces granulatus TaxID=519963 RepID=A0A232M0R8_9EURO|nr:hypothetical protein Egran_02258 [Elaphomyces granulatus]